MVLSLKMPDWIFKNQEVIQRIGNFLTENHKPTQENIEYKQQENPEETLIVQEGVAKYAIKTQINICSECDNKMEIWSKYGYFWKCTSCGKSIAINEKCPGCKTKLKIRKEKTKYFLYCEKCGIERLYHDAGK